MNVYPPAPTAHGTGLARDLNLNRESLYRYLSQDGNPSFVTVAKALDNLGYQLSVKQKIPA
ncbi:MAG: hypothetical protein FWG71_10010 [Synergistaceae bacterium]|nr:hypothetical protein [Synergistaceae bacterium]